MPDPSKKPIRLEATGLAPLLPTLDEWERALIEPVVARFFEAPKLATTHTKEVRDGEEALNVPAGSATSASAPSSRQRRAVAHGAAAIPWRTSPLPATAPSSTTTTSSPARRAPTRIAPCPRAARRCPTAGQHHRHDCRPPHVALHARRHARPRREEGAAPRRRARALRLSRTIGGPDGDADGGLLRVHRPVRQLPHDSAGGEEAVRGLPHQDRARLDGALLSVLHRQAAAHGRGSLISRNTAVFEVAGAPRADICARRGCWERPGAELRARFRSASICGPRFGRVEAPVGLRGPKFGRVEAPGSPFSPKFGRSRQPLSFSRRNSGASALPKPAADRPADGGR